MTSQSDNRASLNAEHNHSSSLLSAEENEQLFQLLGTKKFTQSTGVAQIFATEPPAHSKWVKLYTGVLCFVKDHGRKSYFMQMYCLDRNELIWEHEVYEPFIINMSRTYLLSFEGSDRIFMFNFVSEEEAKDYLQAARNLMTKRMKRQEERSRRTTRPLDQSTMKSSKDEDDTVTLRKTKHSITTTPTKHNIYTVQPQQKTVHAITTNNYNTKKDNDKKKKTRKVVTKADIGTPTGFTHVTHVGWDSFEGFKFEGDDEEALLPFLEKAGVSKKLLKNRETKQFILDYIQTNNVLETIKSEQTGPPVPKRQSQTSSDFQKPNRTAPPPPPGRTPPHLTNVVSKPPRVNMPNPPKRGPQVTGSGSPSAPPPPPPPPTSCPPPPPPPAMSNIDPSSATHNQPPSESDPRSALLESIRQGATLKKVSERRPSGSSNRDDFLSEIRQGTKLRPAEERSIRDSSPPPQPSESSSDALALALKRALEQRKGAIQSDSDDDTDESFDNDDEWED